MRILQLPPAIANQIAAGEVIERPASVVKELLENSLDAGANSISIEISYGGLNQIKISDNGHGILAQDLPLALAPHATSKIKTLNDLYAIHSMGFRGEALASIASVSKLSLNSKTAEQTHAMSLRVVDNGIELSPCARSTGTTVDVTDIFYNAPVRKRFLKNEKLEFQAIETVVKRFAMSAPHIAITLKHNGKLILTLPQACNESAQKKRMTKLLGTSFAKNAVFLEVEHANMRLQGWISDPNFQRSHNDKLWVYINQRMVKDKLIHHALKQVYEGILHPGRFPACLLYFSIPNAEVDVNVHPTKHEVRFVQPKLVHDFFTSQLTAALNSVMSKQDKLALAHIQNACVPSCIWPAEKSILRGDISLNDSPPSEGALVYLNHRYLLMVLQQQPYMVDVHRFLQEQTRQQLKRMPLPLNPRELLVPIHIDLNQESKDKIIHLKDRLFRLGLDIECPEENRLILNTIPSMIPNLDIRFFFTVLQQVSPDDLDQILDLLCRSQRMDVRLLNDEDRMQMQHHLQAEKDLSALPWAKILTEEDCRMWMYA